MTVDERGKPQIALESISLSPPHLSMATIRGRVWTWTGSFSQPQSSAISVCVPFNEMFHEVQELQNLLLIPWLDARAMWAQGRLEKEVARAEGKIE